MLNIFDSLSLLIQHLPVDGKLLAADAQAMVDAVEGDALLLTQQGFEFVEGSNGHYHFRFLRGGKYPIAPAITLEYGRDVHVDYSSTGSQQKLTNIQGLRVSTKLGPIKLAAAQFLSATYSQRANGVTHIDARLKVQKFGVGVTLPLKLLLNADWSFGGLG